MVKICHFGQLHELGKNLKHIQVVEYWHWCFSYLQFLQIASWKYDLDVYKRIFHGKVAEIRQISKKKIPKYKIFVISSNM
jgi:hypothetical protein